MIQDTIRPYLSIFTLASMRMRSFSSETLWWWRLQLNTFVNERGRISARASAPLRVFCAACSRVYTASRLYGTKLKILRECPPLSVCILGARQSTGCSSNRPHALHGPCSQRGSLFPAGKRAALETHFRKADNNSNRCGVRCLWTDDSPVEKMGLNSPPLFVCLVKKADEDNNKKKIYRYTKRQR